MITLASAQVSPANFWLNQVFELKSGRMVKVAANFLAEEQDFINESTITKEGSMTGPEIIVKFTRVEKTQ